MGLVSRAGGRPAPTRHRSAVHPRIIRPGRAGTTAYLATSWRVHPFRRAGKKMVVVAATGVDVIDQDPPGRCELASGPPLHLGTLATCLDVRWRKLPESDEHSGAATGDEPPSQERAGVLLRDAPHRTAGAKMISSRRPTRRSQLRRRGDSAPRRRFSGLSTAPNESATISTRTKTRLTPRSLSVSG